MKEIGVKIGTAKNEPFTGRQRGHINQRRKGTISHSTLMDVLREDLSTYGRVYIKSKTHPADMSLSID
jgi:hypothetical protein